MLMDASTIIVMSIVAIFVGCFMIAFGIAGHSDDNLSDADAGFFLVLGMIVFVVGFFFLVDTLDETSSPDESNLSKAYVMYRAYDDKEFDFEELKVIETLMEDEKLFKKLVDGDLTDRDVEEYEEFVNDSIKRFDSSEGHLAFKEYVLVEKESNEFLKLEDVSDDERMETDLVKFAEDVLDAEGDSYNELLFGLGKKYPKFGESIEQSESKDGVIEGDSDTFEIKK